MRRLLLVVLVCLTWPAVAGAADRATLRGTLVERHTDAADGSKPTVAYSLDTAAGDVALADDQREALIGQRVRLQDASAEAGVQGRAQAEDTTRLASSTGTGPHKVAVLLVNFTDKRTQPVTPDQIRSTVFTGTSSVDAFYRSQSDGAVSITGRDRPDGDVYGWYELPIASTGCDADAIATAARKAATDAGVSLAGYDHVVYFFPTVSACGYAGLGEMPGSEAWINGYNQASVIAHELGHNMGVHHAASRACTADGAPAMLSSTCTDTEYGDPFDVMGNGSKLMSSWHRAQLGQLPAAGQRTVTASGTYAVGSANDFAAGGATKLLLIPRKRLGQATATQAFAVEIRSALAPFDAWGTGAPATTGVTVRLVPQLTTRTQSYLLDAHPADGGMANAPLQPGQSFTDPDSGITISAVAAGGGSASVTVSLPGPADTTPPTPPSAVTAAVAGKAVRVSWGGSTDDVGVARYEVLRDGVLLGSTAGTSFDDASWAGLTSATYEVDAVDDAGNRAPSATRPTLALPDVTAPGAPTGLRATRSGSSVTLRWDAATDDRGVSGYVVTRDGAPLATAGGRSYTDAAAGAGTRAYAVAARDAAGNTGPAAGLRVGAVPAAVKPVAPPAAPASRPAAPVVAAPPTVLLASPWLIEGRAPLPRGGRLVFRASRTGRIVVRVGRKRIRAVTAARVSFKLPARYRRKRSVRLTVTLAAGGRKATARFLIRRNVVRAR